MKVYRVHYWSSSGSSAGYGYFWAKKDAMKAAHDYDREDPKDRESVVDVIFFDKTKGGIMTLLAYTAMHPNNG